VLTTRCERYQNPGQTMEEVAAVALAVAAAVADDDEEAARTVAILVLRYFGTKHRSDLEMNYSATGLGANTAEGNVVGWEESVPSRRVHGCLSGCYP
jgi:hypothetical protein